MKMSAMMSEMMTPQHSMHLLSIIYDHLKKTQATRRGFSLVDAQLIEPRCVGFC
jgi:hypothetical protein